jgi:FkbM family methyltransferase
MRFFPRRGRPAAKSTGRNNLRDWLRGYLKDPALNRDLRQGLRILYDELRRLHLEMEFVRSRQSCYVGDGIALTYLADETPVFVNANDMGGPFNLINGGRYEEDNLEVMFSFLKEDSVFLDIGANLGFYTLVIGKRLGPCGRVLAFEPHPKLFGILARNIYVNGLMERAQYFNFGLSDRNEEAVLQYPDGHLGGGRVAGPEPVAGHSAVAAELKRLDDLVGAGFRCDLVKIDVEGHEISVLNGMREVVANSPDIKILFEKLGTEIGSEAALEGYFRESGLLLFGVCPDSSLQPLAPGELSRWSGYVIAARPESLTDGYRRARFSIYGGQLLLPDPMTTPTTGPLTSAASEGEMLFHGPYWFLRRGVWRFRFHGEIAGDVRGALWPHRCAVQFDAKGGRARLCRTARPLVLRMRGLCTKPASRDKRAPP